MFLISMLKYNHLNIKIIYLLEGWVLQLLLRKIIYKLVI